MACTQNTNPCECVERPCPTSPCNPAAIIRAGKYAHVADYAGCEKRLQGLFDANGTPLNAILVAENDGSGGHNVKWSTGPCPDMPVFTLEQGMGFSGIVGTAGKCQRVIVGADGVMMIPLWDGTKWVLANPAGPGLCYNEEDIPDVGPCQTAYGLVLVRDCVGGSNRLCVAKMSTDVCNTPPAGVIEMFGGPIENIPPGRIPCDGSLLSVAAYPALFAAIGYSHGGTGGQFRAPDIRGRFVRGVDNGIARDPDRAARTAANVGGNAGDNVGSVQGHAFQLHEHDWEYSNASYSAVYAWASAPFPDSGNPVDIWVADPQNNNITVGSPKIDDGCNSLDTACETRPLNIYVEFMISIGFCQ